MDIEKSARRIIGREGEPEEAALDRCRDRSRDVEEGRRIDCARRRIEDLDDPALLDDEDAAGAVSGAGDEERLGEAGSAPAQDEGADAPRQDLAFLRQALPFRLKTCMPERSGSK